MIYWIASYPKSGNTWFRTFLANYLHTGDVPLNINQLGTIPNFNTRSLFDRHLGWETADLDSDLVDDLRSYVQDSFPREARRYFKVHEAFLHPRTGRSLFSGSLCAAVYIIRNPMDIVPSLANHFAISLDKAIDFVNQEDAILRLNSQLPQALGSWSWHVQTWTTNAAVSVKVLRYEDLIADSAAVFRQAIDFLQLDFAAQRFDRAMKNSEFSLLKSQEEILGFREAPPNRQFFMTGKPGAGKLALDEGQKRRVQQEHLPVMREHGYSS